MFAWVRRHVCPLLPHCRRLLLRRPIAVFSLVAVLLLLLQLLLLSSWDSSPTARSRSTSPRGLPQARRGVGRVLGVAPLSTIPAASQLINIHQLMVEVKKYKPTF